MGKGSPEWQRAKPLLEHDYDNVQGIREMTVNQVIALRPDVYGKVKRTNFANNWKKVKENMSKPPEERARKRATGPTTWEIARPLLEEDYLSGVATADMTPAEVVSLRTTIYGKVPKTNFSNNWRALKKRIDGDKERARKDQERYDHDVGLYPLAIDLPWEWHGSEAERLLKMDVESGRHLRFHPTLLFLKRKEYQEFDYEIFRKHIHQEARSALETPYWMVQKEKKEKKKKMIEEAVEKALEDAEEQEFVEAFEKYFHL